MDAMMKFRELDLEIAARTSDGMIGTVTTISRQWPVSRCPSETSRKEHPLNAPHWFVVREYLHFNDVSRSVIPF
jgi:hypothetical protein